MYEVIFHAVRAGHRKLAAKMMNAAEKVGSFGFNHLHKEVCMRTSSNRFLTYLTISSLLSLSFRYL